MEEIWKVAATDDLFMVSTLGNVRKRNKDGVYEDIEPSLHPDNYYFVGGNTFGMVHRLVATTFVPNDDPIHKTVIDHINNDSLDNRACNLGWVTREENTRRARKSLPKDWFKIKKVKCVETGEIYLNQKDASRRTGIRYESICGSCKFGTSVHGLHFVKVEEDNK